MLKKVDIVVQARSGSTRLKNKILLKIGNKTLLEYHMERLQQSKLANRIIVATTENKEDDKIVELCKKKDYLYFRGSEKNVYDRFYKTSLKYKSDFILRMCSDQPFVDYEVIDNAIIEFSKNDYDYLFTIGGPIGVDYLGILDMNYLNKFVSLNWQIN